MKLLFLTITILLWNTEAKSKDWKIFYLETISLKKILDKNFDHDANCTGTLLKINGKCHLISNAHCFNRNDDFAFASLHKTNYPEYFYDIPKDLKKSKSKYDFFENDENFLALTSLRKRFITKDLAELEIPKKMMPYCEELKSINLKKLSNITQKPRAYAALGHYMTLETISFTKDIAWHRSKGKVTLKSFETSLNLSSFYQIPELTIYRGMSGGLLIDHNKNPIGILTQYIPYQNNSFIIGLDEVERFVNESKEPTTAHPEIQFSGNNNSDDVKENGNGNGKENGNGNGKENGNGNGKENGNGNGTDRETEGEGPSLSLFRMPNDGVPLPGQKDTILLGKCGNQIDGYNDYIKHKDCHEDIVTRPKLNYPEESIREGILSRIFKNLDGKILTGIGQTPYFFAHPYAIDQWQKISQGYADVTASVNGHSIYILSNGKSSLGLWNGEKLKGYNDRAYQIHFYMDNSKTISAILEYAQESPLLNGGTQFTHSYLNLKCDNKNYLKLICFNEHDNVEFSLSKRSVTSDTLDYRLILKTGIKLGNIEGLDLVINNYGEVTVDEKGELPHLSKGHPILLNL